MKLNEKLLWSILHTESESGNCDMMIDLVLEHCQTHKYDARQDTLGNIYITKGNATTYPCIVAHMDTVHDITGDGIALVQLGDNVTAINPATMEQTGIGGDDKCGIYAALHCLSSLPCCKVALFVDEEVGCIGSYAADISFFSDCRFILQADRRGNSDFVTDICGPLSSPAFQSAIAPVIKSHGYKTCAGAMSDVMALAENKVGVSVANMSAGYYNPHQACEYINLEDLANVTEMMLAICKLKDSFPFIREARKSPRVKTFRASYYSEELEQCGLSLEDYPDFKL